MPSKLAGNPARVLARLSKVVEHALGDDLSLPQYRLLAFLAHGDRAASALADRLDVSRPSITGLVDGLVKRGLVERRNSTDDRRRVDHVITPAGKTALTAADRAVNERLEVIAARLPDDEGAAALKAIAKLESALDAGLQKALAR
jgi:long-chain acyl-CoA synthetase